MNPAGGVTNDPDRVVLVPVGESLANGFSLARKALRNGETVRIVGCGVTYRDVWPTWASEEPRLSLVELGSYQFRSRMEGSRGLAESLRDWCDRVFGGLLEGLQGAETFAGGAAGRLLQESMDCAAVVEGIKLLHGEATVEVTNPSWAGRALLEGDELGSSVAIGRAVLPLLVAAGVTASVLRVLREYRRGAPSREKMERTSPGDTPTLWLGLIPDRFRGNKHLIETLGMETLARRRSLGVLFTQSLGVGTREEISQVVEGDEVWPGLGPLLEYFPSRLSIAQAVMPSRPLNLLRGILRGVMASVRATVRVMSVGPPPYAGWQAVQLAKLLSHDVISAALAADAARQARAVFPRESRIVFSAAALPSQAAAERTLHHLGIATAEYMHGLGSDSWHGMAESHAATRIVWTHTDRAGQSPTGQEMVVAGLPAPSLCTSARGSNKILILTNYFHRNIVVAHGGTKRAPYQRELLAVPAHLRSALPGWPFEFRWRAHPAEVPDLIERAHEKLDSVELSRGRGLEEDLAWADLVISAHSSAAAQAMFVGLPVFVHLRPEMVHSPFTAYVSESRRFQTAQEAVALIVPCLRDLASGDPNVLRPECQAREALVGGTTPTSLFEGVSQWSARLDFD